MRKYDVFLASSMLPLILLVTFSIFPAGLVMFGGWIILSLLIVVLSLGQIFVYDAIALKGIKYVLPLGAYGYLSWIVVDMMSRGVTFRVFFIILFLAVLIVISQIPLFYIEVKDFIKHEVVKGIVLKLAAGLLTGGILAWAIVSYVLAHPMG